MSDTDPMGDEERRLDALASCDILDTPPEPAFEEVATLVQAILQVPICAVSLVDRHRQWFKARRGLAVSETPRDIAFCAHTIRAGTPLVVPDTHLDARFAENPLVTGAPHIRAYAGIPLICSEGYRLGSLCAIDTAPRSFHASEIALLHGHARTVIDLLEVRRSAGGPQALRRTG